MDTSTCYVHLYSTECSSTPTKTHLSRIKHLDQQKQKKQITNPLPTI